MSFPKKYFTVDFPARGLYEMDKFSLLWHDLVKNCVNSFKSGITVSLGMIILFQACLELSREVSAVTSVADVVESMKELLTFEYGSESESAPKKTELPADENEAKEEGGESEKTFSPPLYLSFTSTLFSQKYGSSYSQFSKSVYPRVIVPPPDSRT